MTITDSHLEAAYESAVALDVDDVLDAWFDPSEVDDLDEERYEDSYPDDPDDLFGADYHLDDMGE